MFENNYPYGMPNYQSQPNYYPQPRPLYPVPSPSPQVPVPQQQSPTNKLYANGIEDVKNRPMPLNSDYIFLDNDKPLVYRKVVDATGKMSVETFKILPYEGDIQQEEYVLRSEFEALKKDIESIRSKKSGGSN